MPDQDGDPAERFDWDAIERTPDFQELVNGRRRFAWTGGTIGVGVGLLYVVLAGVAPDLMGTHLFGFLACWLGTVLSQERGAERTYEELRVRAETGIGAA